MQRDLGFLRHDVGAWRERLMPMLAVISPLPRRSPIGQLVKSMISGRTRDAVSLAAYERLRARYGSPARLAGADPQAVERVIGDVTFAADKALHLTAALRLLREGPGLNLGFLGDQPVERSLAFLESLPGVGRKVAASTLNASTLAMPVLIVDTHVWRVLRRLGVIANSAPPRAASEAATAAMPDWTGEDFLTFHMLTKHLGQTICTDRAPACGRCPLAGCCPGVGVPTGRKGTSAE